MKNEEDPPQMHFLPLPPDVQEALAGIIDSGKSQISEAEVWATKMRAEAIGLQRAHRLETRERVIFWRHLRYIAWAGIGCIALGVLDAVLGS